MVFKSPYAKNPFDSVSAEELEEYKKMLDRKNKGETEPALSPGDDTFADTTDPGDVTSPATGDETVRSPMSPTTDTEHDGDHYNGEETDGNRTLARGRETLREPQTQ